MSKRILLVEDDPINVKFIKLVLSKKGGYEVVHTEEVPEVLRLAREGDLAAIIMDVSLTKSMWGGEKVDGLFITRLLKQDEATRDIPVLLATAHAMYGDKEKFLRETGAEGYFPKPIHDPDAFVACVRAVMKAESPS